MAVLNRDQILQADDLKTEIVPVPEWGGDVKVRSMTAFERDQFETFMLAQRKEGDDKPSMENFRAGLCAWSIVTDEGKPMFGEPDIQALSEKSAAAMNRVFDAAQRLSGFSDKDVTDLAKT